MRSIVSALRSAKPLAHEEHRKILKFVVSGGAKTVAMYGLYWLLVEIGLHYQIALIADYVGGVLLGYVLQRFWTFRSHGRPSRGFEKYLLVNVLIYVSNSILLGLGVEVLRLDEQLAQIPALALVTVASYLLQRFWVFRPRR